MSKLLNKLSVVLVVFALTAGSLMAADEKIEEIAPRDNFDLNSIVVDGELYIWNRVSDLLDILRGGIAGGPGIGAEIAITEYAQLGAYANVERGVTFPHFIFPLWIIDYYENNEPIFTEHIGGYATVAFGPWRAENRTDATEIDYFFPRDRWDIRVQLDAALLHLYLAASPLEFYDFLAGIVGLDPAEDDMKLDINSRRRPVDQLGRGICNLLFGFFEIPKTTQRVVAEEGDFPGFGKGISLGVWRFLCREVVGAVEIVTFPFGWEPIIEPAYVICNDRNATWRVYRPAFQKASVTNSKYRTK